MSDIDLATLHKTRLEEKVNYKLSWWANTKNNNNAKHNNSIDGCCDMKSAAKQYNCHKKKPVVKLSSSNTAVIATGTNSKSVCEKSPSKKTSSDKIVNQAKKVDMERVGGYNCDNNYGKQQQIKNKYECKYKSSSEFDDLSDDGYFSSETRRRRSGTWP